MMRDSLALPIPDALLDEIVERVTAEVVTRVARESWRSPYLTVAEAAAYIRAKPQRIYDLLSARHLTRHKDGRRVLVSRHELDEYLASDRATRVATGLPATPKDRITRRLVR
jgi:excisionase family DNA binding protein